VTCPLSVRTQHDCPTAHWALPQATPLGLRTAMSGPGGPTVMSIDTDRSLLPLFFRLSLPQPARSRHEIKTRFTRMTRI
jgi:hypothetical protein